MQTSQLTLAELKRLFIHRFPYIALFLIWIILDIVLLVIPELKDDYDEMRTSLQQNHGLALRLADEGHDFKEYELYEPGFSLPDGYPLTDEQDNLIPENVTFAKSYIDEFYTEKQVALVAPHGPFSLETIISEIQWRFHPSLFIWAVLAVFTFALDYRDGRYRKLISKGVSRSQILASKTILTIVAAVVFAAVMTLITTYFGHGAYTGLEDVTAPSFGSILATAFTFNIFWLSAWMFFAYFLLCGVVSLAVSMVNRFSNLAMLSAFVVLGMAFIFTLDFNPCDTSQFGNLVQFTMGYNFNSLHQFFWLNSENYECYRTPWLAALIALAFTTLIYFGMRFTFTRRRLSKENLKDA